MPQPLTEQMVLLHSKASSLENVKTLHVYGDDIDNLSILSQLPNVEVLSLSLNRITTLRDFASCTNLKELYLRRNCIAQLSEVFWLSKLAALKSLWLEDNPCAKHPQYRLYVTSILPSLKILDNKEITIEERRDAAQMPKDRVKAEPLPSPNGQQRILSGKLVSPHSPANSQQSTHPLVPTCALDCSSSHALKTAQTETPPHSPTLAPTTSPTLAPPPATSAVPPSSASASEPMVATLNPPKQACPDTNYANALLYAQKSASPDCSSSSSSSSPASSSLSSVSTTESEPEPESESESEASSPVFRAIATLLPMLQPRERASLLLLLQANPRQQP